MRKLSEIKSPVKGTHAVCTRCGEVFLDDIPVEGLVYCPNDTGEVYHYVWRGMTEAQALKRARELETV